MIPKTSKCTICRKEVDNQLFDHELGMCDMCSDEAWNKSDNPIKELDTINFVDRAKPFIEDFEESIGE